MQQVIELSEQLAAAVVGADPADLQGLAQIHSRCQEISAHVQASGAGGPLAPIGEAARSAEQLVTRLILHEFDDAAAVLRSLEQTVTQLQQLVGGISSGQDGPEPTIAPVAAPAPQPQAPPSPAAEQVIAAETTINADDASLVQEFVSEARSHIESAEAAVLTVEERPDDMEAINAIFRSFHTIKGVAGFLNLKQIGSLAHSAESLLDQARKGQLKLSGSAVDLVLASIDLMKELINDLVEAVNAQRAPSPNANLSALLRRLADCAAKKLEVGEQAPPTLGSPTTGSPTPAVTEVVATGEPGSRGGSADATVKVATTRLDSLINMVGELVIAESMVRQDITATLAGNQRLARHASHLGKITRELQELSMSMRMVPIHGVFQKMARVVRDLARRAGKQIEFVTTGGETELDRNVVEAISDPLVHMVRNSVDHGIESPEARAKAGKNPSGRVELKAYHQGGSIVIQIADDGKGLDREKILRKATEAGLVKEGQTLSDQEVFALIFHAGLSTAEKVTEVSGRGVGMDVVRRNIESLRGRVEIASKQGRGSTFTIHLPLTLAVIDGLVARVGSERYILSMTSIEQSLRPRAEQLSSVQGRGELCLVRNQLMPLCRLYRLFGVKPVIEDPTQALVVIVQDNGRRCCLMVDELLGQQQVVIKSLGDGIGTVKGISGGAILGDGNVSLIVDVPGLIDLALQH